MFKKFFIFLLIFASFFSYNAYAEENNDPVIVVIDTALDITIPDFQNKIINEVCILEINNCPNGKNYMEGKGASFIPIPQMQKNGFDHGTYMVSALIKTNPNVKIIFIRIASLYYGGVKAPIGEASFVRSLDWVIENKEKFNIQAVSMSQGHHNLSNVSDYCPKTISISYRIKKLLNMDVPVFLPTGNNGDYKKIDWPACIDSSISIGSSSVYEEISNWSNIDINKTDFFTIGAMKLIGPGNIEKKQFGTSISTQVAAANWLALKKLKPSYSYQQIYDSFKRTSVSILNIKKIKGDMMNLEKALNE